MINLENKRSMEKLILSTLDKESNKDTKELLLNHMVEVFRNLATSKASGEEWNTEAYENRIQYELIRRLRDALDDPISEIKAYLADHYMMELQDLFDGFFVQNLSRETYRTKYAISDDTGQRMERDVFESLLRVAIAVSSVEMRKFLNTYTEAQMSDTAQQFAENAIKTFAEFFTMLAFKQFSGGGRIMANAGAWHYKNNTTLINCTVMQQIPDSIEGIMDVAKEAALSLKAGAGVGYNFSTIRPKGAFVRGAGAETSGVLSFMEIFDRTCNTIMSAGGRRGAQMATLHVEHPEVRQFISAKREDGVLRYFNLSVLPTDHFMQSVENDDTIDLWFWEPMDEATPEQKAEAITILAGDIPYSHPDSQYFLFDANHVEVKYGNTTPDTVFKKVVYETVSANELYDAIMESNYEFAEPGFILIDRINNMNPLQPYGEFIQATNPCVTGDTLVPTEKGLVRIDSLVEESEEEFLTVTDLRPNFDTSGTSSQKAKAIYSGVKPVTEIVTERGFKLRATGEHLIFTDKGYVKAQDLTTNSRVAIQSDKNPLRDIEGEAESASVDGMIMGIFSHNGEIVTDDDGRLGYRLHFSGHEQATFTVLHDHFMQTFSTKEKLNEDSEELDDDVTAENVTEETANLDYDIEYDETTGTNVITYYDTNVVEWFTQRGFSSDYDFTFVPESITSAGKRMLSGFLHGVFNSLGRLHQLSPEALPKKFNSRKGAIFNSGNFAKQVHLLLLDEGVISRLEEANGFYCISAEENQVLPYYVIYDKVTSLTPMGEEKVYDLQVEMAHTFIANGMVVHNCGEQPLCPSGSCNLGSMLLHSFVKEPFAQIDPYENFNWETFAAAVRTANRFLDNINDITNLPLESLRYQAWYKRRHGLGVTGVSDMLSALNIRYGSEESIAFLDRVFGILAAESLLTSYQLAMEKSPAPIYSMEGPDRISESRYFQQVLENSSAEYADVLEKYAKANSPMRFSHATSIAPTGTMSLTWGDNVANGIEPTFSHSYVRNIRIAGKQAKVQERVYSLAYLWYLSKHGIEHSDDLELPHYLATTDNIKVHEHIEVQSVAQKWIDSSVSKTCNVPTDYDYDDFKNAYLTAWKRGLKGFTTFRFNPNFSVGVLTRDSDLKNTNYEFTYIDDDGNQQVMTVAGDENVQYMGEVMNSANLYEALKEKLFGKM